MSQDKTTPAEPEDRTEADFVSRWSRLKHQAAKDTATATTESSTTNSAAENTGTEHAQASSTRILTDEDMPPIESLTPDSDYADFLSPGVSEGLRKLALRKLFHGEAFNIRDGLDEYDGDYTQFEKLGDIVTSDMQHQLEREAQRKAEQLLQDGDQSSDAGSIHDVETMSDNDEPVDQNIAVTAKNNDQPDGLQIPADAENIDEAELETRSGEKNHVE
jgi:hypothetical protein